MMLGELIKALEAADQRLILPDGFDYPHSWRGVYADLAFEPAKNVPIAAMLADARDSLGKTFEGYKGGDNVMGEYTDCWLDFYGSSNGESLGPRLLAYMIAAGKLPEGMPEVDASDVMSDAEEAELVAAVSGGHDPADYVEVTRPETATTTTHVEYSVYFPYAEADGGEAWDHSEPMDGRVDADNYLAYVLERKGRGTLVSRTVTVSQWQDAAASAVELNDAHAVDDDLEELDDNPGAACYHAFIDLDPQRGEVFTDLTGQSFVVVEGDTGPHLFSLRSGSRYNFMAVMSIGLLTRARIVPADASVLTGPTGAAICGAEDEYVRVRVNGAAPGEPEWADMHLSPARARDLFVQLADALDAIVLEQPTAGATRDLVTVMPGYWPSAPPVMVLIDGVRRVLLATGCRNCDGTPDASLTRDQARTLAAHITLAADDAEKNTPA